MNGEPHIYAAARQQIEHFPQLMLRLRTAIP